MGQEELNYSELLSDDNLLKYIESIFVSSEAMYVSLMSGLIEKILIKWDEEQDSFYRVIKFNKKDLTVETTNLPFNSEEDYVILNFVEVNESNIPVFSIEITKVVLNTIDFYLYNKVILPYHEYKYRKQYKND